VPASVTVPPNKPGAYFTVDTKKVTTNHAVTVTATYGGKNVVAAITVTP
jgi:hypothetical protein